MTADPAKTAPLFAAGRFVAVPIGEADVPALQRFIERNPEYAITVEGAPPGHAAARRLFDERPPAGLPYGSRWLLRFVDDAGEWAGIAEGLSDFVAPGVWHIGLFVVATSLHGSGAATSLLRALEAWMAAQSAAWVRLGVVVGHARAERFWSSEGYAEVRQRDGVPVGARSATVRVMVKSLAGRPLAEYLARVARDRAEPGA